MASRCVAIASLLASLLAGCATVGRAAGGLGQLLSTGKGPRSSAVASIDFTLGSRTETTMLRPGETTLVDVVVTDKKGARYSTAEGTLDPSFVAVRTSPLAVFDRNRMTLTIESDPATIGGRPIQVTVVYRGDPRVTASRSFTADVAYFLGPEPHDVRGLTVEVGTGAQGGALIPGEAVPLVVAVTDVLGREYRTAGGRPRLPLERLVVSTERMRFDPDTMTVTPDADLERVVDRGYSVTVSYEGLPGLAVTRRFEPDVAAVRGPEPADVAALSVRLGADGRAESIAPGASLPLVVEVRDTRGRAYRPGGLWPKAMARRLKLSTTLLAYDSGTGTLTADADGRRLLGKQPSVTVWYEGREDLKVTRTLTPDFVSGLAELFLDGHEMVFAGPAGQPGDRGRDGQPGRAGHDATATYGTGSPGGQGTDGEPGRPGRAGGAGPRVRVTAARVTSVDRKATFVLVQVEAGAGPATYLLRRPSDPPLVVRAVGGQGGAGGRGGDGGPGGAGGDGWSTGSGGAGGDGGTGGAGGPGGPGGQITLTVASADLASEFVLEADGGPGGAGGEPGAGGSGGPAGNTGGLRAVTGLLDAFNQGLKGNATYRTPDVVLGQSGPDGLEGYPGEPGRDGPPGRTAVTVDPEAAPRLKRRLPPAIAGGLLFLDP